MHAPFRNGVDLRSKDRSPPMQRVTDYEVPPPATPPLELDDTKASIGLLARHAGGPATRIRVRMAMETYLSMGSPQRVSATLSFTDSRRLIIRKSATGMKVTPKGGGVFVDFARKKLGAIAETFAPINVPCEVHSNRVVLSRLPEWFEDAGPIAQNAVNAEILPKQKEEPKPAADLSLKLSVQKAGASLSLRFALPMEVLGHLGDPKRVLVTGTAHQGFKIEPVFKGGVAVNYNTGSYVYLLAGMSGRGLSKDLRKPVTLRAYHKDGAVIISGPPHEWISVGFEFRISDEKSAPIDKPKQLVEGPLRGEATSPPPKETPIIAALAPISATVQSIKDELNVILGKAVRLRDQLSEKTGLQFVITSAGKLMVK